MKKSNYLIALALGASTITFAQNVGINTDGSDPDTDAILHVKDNNSDSSVVRVENEQAKLTKFELRNTSAKWDLRIPTGATDLRINNGSGQDHVTIQNDGDVGIGTTSPASTLDVNGSMGLKVNTIASGITLDQTYNVILCNTGPYTVTLPPAASNTGRVYLIKNIDSECDDITIDGNSTETIDGSATYVLDSYNNVVRIISDGSNWFIINENTVACTYCDLDVTWTYNGGSVTYGTILSYTGECWMDRNLGASQVATSSTDHLGYGDLFQWGRGADGHQLITWTNSTTGNGAGTTPDLSTTDTPGNSLYITVSGAPKDWRNSQNDNLWQGVSGTNNPCPSGWRLPTETEWAAERNNGGDGYWGGTDNSKNNKVGAFSVLKLPVAGARTSFNGGLSGVGTAGDYWSSTVSGTNARYLTFSSDAYMFTWNRSFGFSVRCLKD